MHPAQPATLPQFLQHLAREESLLRAALANVTALHTALRAGDLGAAQTLSIQQETLSIALRETATVRAGSLTALAREFGLSGEGVTLSALAMKLSDAPAAEVRAARDRLAAVAAELSALHARNANLLAHLRSFFRGVLSGLSASTAPQRYGPSGDRLEPAAGVAIHAHG